MKYEGRIDDAVEIDVLICLMVFCNEVGGYKELIELAANARYQFKRPDRHRIMINTWKNNSRELIPVGQIRCRRYAVMGPPHVSQYGKPMLDFSRKSIKLIGMDKRII